MSILVNFSNVIFSTCLNYKLTAVYHSIFKIYENKINNFLSYSWHISAETFVTQEKKVVK